MVCPDLRVIGDVRISFGDTETRFLCGDKKNASWANPPENQVKLFLISFLQSRGFFQPEFSRDGQILVVDIGSKSRIKLLSAAGDPPELDFSRFWVPALRPLTPSLLDDYEALVRGRIQGQGYPCPRVKAEANAADGSMTMTVESGPRQKIIAIKEESVVGLGPHVLRRYYPIEEGDWFDGDLVSIANERIKAEDILASSYMVSTCDADGAVVDHRAASGPSRRFTVGFGVNTETFFLVQSTYRNARVDANASRFDAVISANFFDQKIESSFDWYFLQEPSSLHFQPKLTFERSAEKSSEVRTATASWHLGGYRDAVGHYWRLYVGPNLNFVRTLRGLGPEYARILEMEVSGRIMSHDYEFYRGAPRSGQLLDWRYTVASARTFSTLTVKTISVEGQRLFNFASLEPPLIVFGVRGGAHSTNAAPKVSLPDEYLYYLGGGNDLRGFSRRSIPSPQAGARSSAYLGAEARLVTIIPYGLQPFVFIDSGKVGASAFAFERPLYYSPGVGLRWQSPFGSLRGSIGRGYVDHPTDDRPVNANWAAFLSFGEEF